MEYYIIQLLLISCFLLKGVFTPQTGKKYVLRKSACCLVALCAANVEEHPWTDEQSKTTAHGQYLKNRFKSIYNRASKSRFPPLFLLSSRHPICFGRVILLSLPKFFSFATDPFFSGWTRFLRVRVSTTIWSFLTIKLRQSV